MAEHATLARPYAKAAFDHAKEVGQLEQWGKELALVSAIVKDAVFQSYISQPQLTQLQKVEGLKRASGELSEGMVNFITQLAEHDRFALLPFVLEEYERLKALGLQETDAVIESAFPLTVEQLELLKNRLEQKFGTKVNLREKVNPALIAGAVIRFGDQVIDDSAAGKLEQMKNHLLGS